MSMPAEHLNPHPTLADLLQGFADAPAIGVTSISSDSRALKPGGLFLACGGESSHALDYIADAVTAGVAAIAWDSTTADAPDADIGIPMIAVPGLGNHLGEIANRFYGRPSEDVHVVGVTGTNGKTSVASFVRQLWEQMGFSAASLGTVGVVEPAGTRTLAHTTPGPIELHRILAELAKSGVTHLALEASSHGLEQRRVDGCGSRPAPSPTSPATISTITRASRPISTRSSACSGSCFHQARAPSSMWIAPGLRAWSRSPRGEGA